MLVFRVKVMELPKHHREELYRTLLELNATEMMHGAYGIEGARVILGHRSPQITEVYAEADGQNALRIMQDLAA